MTRTILTPRARRPTRSLALLLLLGACSDYSVEGGFDGDAEPDILVSPERVVFSGVVAGEEAVATVEIRNLGSATLSLGELRLDPAGSFTLLEDLDGAAVPGGEARTLEVAFRPVAELEEALLRVASNDPDSPEVLVSLVGEGLLPRLVLSPEDLALPLEGDACFGEAALTLTNEGAAPLEVEDLLILGVGFETPDLDGALGTYAPGEERTLAIRSQGTAALTGELWAASNDPRGDQVARLETSARVLASLPAAERALELDGVCLLEETLTFDRGADCEEDGSLLLKALELDSDELVLTWPTALPHTFAAGEPVELTLTSTSSAMGAVSGELQVWFGDESEPTTTTLSGSLDEELWFEDVFMRDGPWEEVDILWYFDGSGSMDDDASRLVDQAGRYMSALSGVDVSWQVGVVAALDGCMHATIPDTTADPAAAFEAAITEALRYEVEQGLGVSLAALQKGGATGCNKGFLRSGAGLRVVMVSDEPDQSSDSWSNIVVDLQAIHPTVRLSAIAGDYPGGCGTASPGAGYYQAVQATYGDFLSICGDDWSDIVDTLATDLAQDPDAPYPLSEEPDPDSISVEVDGLLRTDWTYDAASNEVSFDAPGAVVAGEEVLIRYRQTCEEGS